MFQSYIKSLDLLQNSHGYVQLSHLMKVMRANIKISGDQYLRQFENVEKMYHLMEKIHANDTRKQLNPLTLEKYPFISHTTVSAALLAMIGYSPTIIACMLGHDLYDHKRENKEPLENVLKDFLKKIRDIITSATYLDQDTLWDEATNTLEIKENALMHRLYWIIQNPEGIAVAGADRFHNLLSISEMPERSARRTISETTQIYLPLLKHYDEILYSLTLEVLRPVTPKDLYLIDPFQLKFSKAVITNYANCRRQHGVLNITISQNFDKLAKEVANGLKKHIMNTELPALLKSDLNPAEHPNIPKYNPNSTVAKKLLAEYQMMANLLGEKYRFGLEEKLYYYTGWAIPLEEEIETILQQRINKRFIQDYFTETSIVDSSEIDSHLLQLILLDHHILRSCTIQTNSGEEASLLEIHHNGPILPVLHYIRNLLQLQSELAVYDDKEDIVAIYEPNDLFARYQPQNNTGFVRADIPHRPFIKLVIKNGYL